MKSPRVSQWMSSPPISIDHRCSLLEAYQSMQSHKVRRLPVLDRSALVGIITIGDIRSYAPLGSMPLLESSKTLSATLVRQAMSPTVIMVAPSAPLATAAQLMLDNQIGGLPVVVGQDLVGVISESDLFRYLIQSGQGITGSPSRV